MSTNDNPLITVQLDTVTAMSVLGNIQLAGRHPANNGPSRQLAVDFGLQLQRKISEVWPDRAALMQMGWDPIFDY